MPKLELSDRFIATLKPQEIAADYFDSKARGLNLRVTPTGVKAWSVMFTSPKDGKRARLSLGTYPATPLAKARALALRLAAMSRPGQIRATWGSLSGGTDDDCDVGGKLHSETCQYHPERDRRLPARCAPMFCRSLAT